MFADPTDPDPKHRTIKYPNFYILLLEAKQNFGCDFENKADKTKNMPGRSSLPPRK